ncbi:MAG: OmpH family outer membrane protein [Bacteroidales bacterium]|jgi:outer membrane protein|nr:OmpH family outer membrane protein [Bacteroidales bacterium]
MKKTCIVIAIALMSLGTAFAQKTVKLGHIDSNELLKIMPGRDSAQTILQNEMMELENELNNMKMELQQMYNDYVAKESQMSDLIKQTKQKDLQDKGTRLEEFREMAQQRLQDREKALLTPIIDKAKQAIRDVAKENGYTYIFDSAVGVTLYEGGDDILPLVKKKLGLN